MVGFCLASRLIFSTSSFSLYFLVGDDVEVARFGGDEGCTLERAAFVHFRCMGSGEWRDEEVYIYALGGGQGAQR